MTFRKALLTAAMTVLAACQQPGGTGPKYQGEPLFTVKGQMALTNGGTAPSGPIRLAVAWYPDSSSNSAPRAMVTQDVQYQGTFPLNYSFSFFGVPPAAALSDYTNAGATTRAAFGVLMAYEDVNGNGQLDTIAAGGSPVDHVLGTSLGDRFNGDDTTDQIYVAYVDGQPPSDWVGYGPGFQLWKSGTIVPVSTSVPIPLHQTNELDFFVCEEFIKSSGYGYDLPCHIAPTDGVRVIGNVYRLDGVGYAGLRITDGTNALSNMTVEVNGAPVAFDAASGLYSAYGTIPVNAPGRNVVRVTPPGQPARVFEMDAPTDFALQAPSDGLHLLAGSPLNVGWTRAAGASFYNVGANRVTPPFASTNVELVYDRGQAQLGTQLSGFTDDDYYQLQVVAFAPNYLARGRGGSMVNTSAIRQAYVDVIAANAGLRVEGTVTHYTFMGQSSGSAWVQAFDGITSLQQATVTLNGDALTWDATYQMFGLDTANVQPGASSTFSLSTSSRSAVSVQVALPGDFTVDPLPASQSKSAPLSLTWSASSGATSYRVWAVDAQGQQLFFDNVAGTSAQIPALNVEGDVYVSVAAYLQGADRHLAGAVQKTNAVTLTP